MVLNHVYVLGNDCYLSLLPLPKFAQELSPELPSLARLSACFHEFLLLKEVLLVFTGLQNFLLWDPVCYFSEWATLVPWNARSVLCYLASLLLLRILTSIISWLLQPRLLSVAAPPSYCSLFVNSRATVHHSSTAPVVRIYSRQPSKKGRLIVSCCVSLPAQISMVEIASKNQDLDGNRNFC